MSSATPAQRRSFDARLVLAAVAMELGLLIPHLASSPAQQVALVLCAYAICTLPYLYVLWMLSAAERCGTRRTALVVLVAGGRVQDHAASACQRRPARM